MLYTGLVAGVVAGNLSAHAMGIDAFHVFVATLILIIPALVGARLLYVAAHWQHYRKTPRRIWSRREGGSDMYGGFLLALLLALPALRSLQLGFGAFWDVSMITILTGMIFARLGCLLNGCCAGRPSRAWISLYLPNHLGIWTRRLPTQYLEAGWAGALLVCALAIRRSMPFPGALALVMAAGYSSGRLLLESLRESERGASRFTHNHAISMVTVAFAVVTLIIFWPR